MYSVYRMTIKYIGNVQKDSYFFVHFVYSEPFLYIPYMFYRHSRHFMYIGILCILYLFYAYSFCIEMKLQLRTCGLHYIILTRIMTK